MRTFFGNLIITAAVVSSSVIARAESTPAPKRLATVDGKEISSAEFSKSLDRLGARRDMVATNPDLRRQYLDHIINSRLLAKAAETASVDKDPVFVERLADLRAELLANVFADQLVAKTSDAKSIQKWFESNKTQFESRELRASHLLFDDEAAARTALTEARAKGADFDQLVKKYAALPGSKQSADLGYFKRGRMLPEFDAAAFATRKGDVHPELVKTKFGWHVIKITDERGTSKVVFKDVEKDVRKAYATHVQKELVDELRRKANVAIDEDAVRGSAF